MIGLVKCSNLILQLCDCVKALHGYFPCLIALLAAEMWSASSVGYYEVGLIQNCFKINDEIFSITRNKDVEYDSTHIYFQCKMM